MAATLLAWILGSLAALHLFWALGGRWGVAAAIPQSGGKPLFRPGPAGTLGIAFLLALGAAGVMAVFDPWLKALMLRGTAAIFAMRAIGEFRYVGFFKSRRDTAFAYWDTRLYSPLCLLMALLAALASY